jgi:hypothetical protein
MTVLGKMMVFLVLVLSIIWNGLVVNAYVTRSNWRAELKKYQDKSVEAAESAYAQSRLLAAQTDAAADTQRVLKEEIASLNKQVEESRTQLASLRKSYEEKLAMDAARGNAESQLQTNNDALMGQVDRLTKTLGEKEVVLNKLNLEAERSKAEETRAQLEAASYQQRYEKLNEQYQNLQERVRDLQFGSASRNPLDARVTAPTGFRGTVRTGGTDLIAFTPGLDAGLQPGSKLTLYRYLPGGNGKFLGTVTVTDVSTKDAVGRFTPPAGVRLVGENIPRPGDELKPADQPLR